MKYINFSLLSVFLILFSCQKVIDLDVNEIEQKLVIDAEFIASEDLVRVKLSKTKDVFSGGDFPLVAGAQAEIVDEAGVSTALTELGEGIYELTGYIPTYNTQYTMRITHEGEVYESSDLLVTPVALDSLSAEFQEESLFGSEGYVVSMNFTDPSGENYYRAVRTVNSEELTERTDQFLFDDGFSEGNQQSVPFFTDRYEIGDTIAVEFRSYSEKTYTFISELFDIAGDSGQSAAPANPNSTWTNEAIGNFAAYGYDKKSIVIEE
jgi:hypothetical protein